MMSLQWLNEKLSRCSHTGGAHQLYATSSWPRRCLITTRVPTHLCRPALAWTLRSPVSFATPLAFAQHQGRKRAGVDDAAVGHLVRLQASLAQPLLR